VRETGRAAAGRRSESVVRSIGSEQRGPSGGRGETKKEQQRKYERNSRVAMDKKAVSSWTLPTLVACMYHFCACSGRTSSANKTMTEYKTTKR
jgi:hypothetical protein